MSKFIAVVIVALALFASSPPLFAEETAAPSASGTPVSGSIVDRDGKPVAKAKVTVIVFSRKDNNSSKTEELVSDKAGAFESKLALDQTYVAAQISASSDGYCPARQYISSQDSLPATLTLWPGHTLKGKIIDEKGRPLSGAKVEMHRCYAWSNNINIDIEQPSKSKTVITGKNGMFEFRNLPSPDDFSYVDVGISVSAPGRAMMNKSILKDAMTGVVKITDPLECKLDGILYLPGKTGVAPEGTAIMLQVPTGRGGSEGRGATVGKDGKFHFTQLPPSKVNVLLDGRRSNQGLPEPMAWALPAVMNVALSPKQPKNIELVMVPGAVIKGMVVDKATGNGVASAQLSINHPGRPENTFPEYAHTNDKGVFSVRVVSGQAAISVESIDSTEGRQHIWFQPDERPMLSVKVAEGEEKSDVTLKVDLTQNNNSSWEVQENPVPPDFELKPGTYDLAWDPDVDCSDAFYISRKYNGDEIKNVAKKLPKIASTKADRCAYVFDGSDDAGLLTVVIDESKGTGKGWDTIYVDMNRNGDLTDDEPIHFTASENREFNTDWFTVQGHQGLAGSDRIDRPIQARLRIYASKDYFYAQLQRRGAWKGTIETNKGKVECVAVDSTLNGACGDLANIDAGNFESCTCRQAKR